MPDCVIVRVHRVEELNAESTGNSKVAPFELSEIELRAYGQQKEQSMMFVNGTKQISKQDLKTLMKKDIQEADLNEQQRIMIQGIQRINKKKIDKQKPCNEEQVQ